MVFGRRTRSLWQPGLISQEAAFLKRFCWQNSPVITILSSRFIAIYLWYHHGVSQWKPLAVGCRQRSNKHSPEVSVRAVGEDQGNVCHDKFPQETSEMRAPTGRACRTLVLLGELLYAASFSIRLQQGATTVSGDLLVWGFGNTSLDSWNHRKILVGKDL